MRPTASAAFAVPIPMLVVDDRDDAARDAPAAAPRAGRQAGRRPALVRRPGAAPPALLLADARPPALLASVPDALVLAEARPPALLALAPFALVLADARPPALLAPAPPAPPFDACARGRARRAGRGPRPERLKRTYTAGSDRGAAGGGGDGRARGGADAGHAGGSPERLPNSWPLGVFVGVFHWKTGVPGDVVLFLEGGAGVADRGALRRALGTTTVELCARYMCPRAC